MKTHTMKVLLVLAGLIQGLSWCYADDWLTINVNPVGSYNVTGEENASTAPAQTFSDLNLKLNLVNFDIVQAPGFILRWTALTGTGDFQYFYESTYFYYNVDLGTQFNLKLFQYWPLQFFIDARVAASNPSPFVQGQSTTFGGTETLNVWWNMLNPAGQTKAWHTLRLTGTATLKELVDDPILNYEAVGSLYYSIRDSDYDVPLDQRQNLPWIITQVGIGADRLQFYNDVQRTFVRFEFVVGKALTDFLRKGLGISLNNFQIGVGLDYQITPTSGLSKWSVLVSKD